MLAKENRLKKFRDFAVLLKEGRICFGNFIDVKNWKINNDKILKNKFAEDSLKIAFLASKKNFKNAVVRNRIKRQMREVVRLLIKEKKIRPGFFLMFMAKKNIEGKSFQEIEKEISFLFDKLQILIKTKKL